MRVGLEPRMSPAFILWTLCCPGQHATLGTQAEEMMTLFGCSRSLPDFKEKAWCLISQLLQPLGPGRCVKLGTSVSRYLLIWNVHLESLVWERDWVCPGCVYRVCKSVQWWCGRTEVDSENTGTKIKANRQGALQISLNQTLVQALFFSCQKRIYFLETSNAIKADPQFPIITTSFKFGIHITGDKLCQATKEVRTSTHRGCSQFSKRCSSKVTEVLVLPSCPPTELPFILLPAPSTILVSFCWGQGKGDFPYGLSRTSAPLPGQFSPLLRTCLELKMSHAFLVWCGAIWSCQRY